MEDGRWKMEDGRGKWALVCGVWCVVVCGSGRKCTEPVTPNVLRSTVADIYIYIYIYIHIHTYIYVCYILHFYC